MSKLPPEQIEANQQRLLAASLKGEAAFREEWNRIFHPENPENAEALASNSSPADSPDS